MIKRVTFYLAAILFNLMLSSIVRADRIDAIKVPFENKLQTVVFAKGYQIYTCILELGSYKWSWVAPDAILYDKKTGSVVGHHGAGPQWKLTDSSAIKAKMIQLVEAPFTADVPWLLLNVTEHEGVGLLSTSRFIQRINTKGGVKPTTGCDSNHLGAEKRMLYSADYAFYGD